MSGTYNLIKKDFQHIVLEGSVYEVGRQRAEILKKENPDAAEWAGSASLDPKKIDRSHPLLFLLVPHSRTYQRRLCSQDVHKRRSVQSSPPPLTHVRTQSCVCLACAKALKNRDETKEKIVEWCNTLKTT